ncbi:MAG: hypothetical protein IKO93_05775 [Lentisphaeria bacterium]|nr:hypothetical protein [Lentisphaeria bacterium]
MKKLIAAAALFCVLSGSYAKDGTFSINPDVQSKVIEAGAPLKIKLNWNCPAGYMPKAWRLVAYVPNLPSSFVQVTGNKVTPNKLKEWSTVFIMDWRWMIPADGMLVKTTAKWPSGDYKMALYVIFQARDKDNKVKSKMISKNILFTLKR